MKCFATLKRILCINSLLSGYIADRVLSRRVIRVTESI